MSAKKNAMFVEDTAVAAHKSVAEITNLLMKAGAVAINHNLEGGKLVGLSFVLSMGGNRVPYSLPVRIDPVFKKINGRRDKWGQWSQQTMAAKDRDQAERVAWRQLFWWLKSQLALIDLGMVQAGEVLWSYMLDQNGRTFFEVHGPKLLAAPSESEGKQ